MVPDHFEIRLPDWLIERAGSGPHGLTSLEQRMLWVISLARLNGEQGTGGPFAAAVFHSKTGELISVGVNLVTSSHLSSAHAELVALSMAQRRAHQYSLADYEWQLLSSAEPCSMCTGAVHWSRIRTLVYGARAADVTEIGFDEGDKPHDWAERLIDRGVQIVGDVQRTAAARALADYLAAGRSIY